MPGWAKIVIAAIAVSSLGLVLALMFNPLTAIDARYGRGSQAIVIGGHIAAGRCDQVALPRSGNATLWSDVCGAMSEVIDADAEVTISDRRADTRPDQLGLVSTKAYGYTLEVVDRSGASRELAITIDEDNRLLHAAIAQVTISPGGAAGYDNVHRYEQSFGFTSLDDPDLVAKLDAAQLLNEALVDALLAGATSGADCSAFHQQHGSTYLNDTVPLPAFVEFSEQVAPTLAGTRAEFGEVRLVAPAGGGEAVAATDVMLLQPNDVAGQRVKLRLFIGHDFENNEWRLRSIFAQEDRLVYATDG